MNFNHMQTNKDGGKKEAKETNPVTVGRARPPRLRSTAERIRPRRRAS